MSSLADFPELVGFFSYSREDDQDSLGTLSALRTRIQGELRGQLGRTGKTFRLWQDKEAIPPGTLWESEIKTAVLQAVFFIPIITPTVVASPYCEFELKSFLAREAELGRNDLVFPILYIEVPDLDDPAKQRNDPVLSLIAKRQYVDWRELRHLDFTSPEVRRAIERFCAHIRDALRQTWISPEDHKLQEEAAAQRQAEIERQREEVETRRRAEEEKRGEGRRRKKSVGAQPMRMSLYPKPKGAKKKSNGSAKRTRSSRELKPSVAGPRSGGTCVRKRTQRDARKPQTKAMLTVRGGSLSKQCSHSLASRYC